MIHNLNSLLVLFAADQSATDSKIYENGLPHATAGSSQLHDLLQILFGIVAALAVLMIVIAALRFITAQGNPQEVSKARSTIVYAVAGLLVAMTAEAIVSLSLVNL